MQARQTRDSGGGPRSSGPPPSSSLSELRSLAAAEHIVHVGRGGMQFVDDASGTNVSTINAGDTVTWVWEGDMNHGVTAGVCPSRRRRRRRLRRDAAGTATDCIPSNTWVSGVQAAGSTYSHTFPTEGNFSYFCSVHLGAMTGKVVVQPAVATGPCVTEHANPLPERRAASGSPRTGRSPTARPATATASR